MQPGYDTDYYNVYQQPNPKHSKTSNVNYERNLSYHNTIHGNTQCIPQKLRPKEEHELTERHLPSECCCEKGHVSYNDPET